MPKGRLLERLMRLVPLALMACAMAACSHDGRIAGTATYRERIALPESAVFEARLEDVSREDAPAVVNSVTIANPGNPPISFAIPYKGEQIDKRHTYSVRGAIRVGDRLLMASDRSYPVITQGMPDAVTLLLRAVPQAPAAQAGTRQTPPAPPLPRRFTGAHGLTLPATFEGVLPCADCPGIRWHLNLMPDQTFYLRREYLERDGYFEDSGRWSLKMPERQLILAGHDGTNEHFAIQGDALEMLDLEGNPIRSGLDYTLRRAADFAWIDVTGALRATYQPGPDGGTLTDCVSGHAYPVAGNARLLSQAGGGGAIALDLRARVTRPEGGDEAALEPLEITRLHPGEGCDRQRPAAPLVNTYWRLVSLDGMPVSVPEGGREPYILLEEDGQFAASMGCNQMSGTYEMTETALRFSQVRSTLMACPGPASDLEARFKRWLPHAASRRLDGRTLDITATDNSSALFEAAYFD